jgi:RNA polymerase sigma-70 factor (ECF subfamily)
MAEPTPFRELLSRVRSGDADAQAELYCRYESVIRRSVRIHRFSGRMRRLLESADICQLVMMSFMHRAGDGQFDLETSKDLLHLLAEMTKNKVIDQARRQTAGRRDVRRTQGGIDEIDHRDAHGTPSQEIVMRELFDKVREKFSAEEWRLAELRLFQQLEWDDVASQVGASPEALRKKLERAYERVRQSLPKDAGGEP